MAKNGKESQKKTSKKRLFQKGGLPGPGRGHKKSNKAVIDIDGLESLQTLGEIIERGLKSKNETIQYKWAVLRLKWLQLKMKYEQEGAAGDHVIDPGIMSMLGDAVNRLLRGDYIDVDGLEDELDD